MSAMCGIDVAPFQGCIGVCVFYTGLHPVLISYHPFRANEPFKGNRLGVRACIKSNY
jgi:hypothetical protein